MNFFSERPLVNLSDNTFVDDFLVVLGPKKNYLSDWVKILHAVRRSRKQAKTP